MWRVCLPVCEGAKVTPADLLTVDEAAALLRLTPGALRVAIARGQIPGVVRFGRRVRIQREALIGPAKRVDSPKP